LEGRRQKHKKTRIKVATLTYLFILNLLFNFFNLLDNIKIKSFERIESCKRWEKIENNEVRYQTETQPARVGRHSFLERDLLPSPLKANQQVF